LSLSFYAFFGLVGILLLLFVWAARKRVRPEKTPPEARVFEECGRGHVAHLPQIWQALAETDNLYISEKASASVLRRVRQERRRVALAYLSAVREDFQSLLRMAKIIARLSPEVVALHEFERARLTVAFGWHYQIVRLQLRAGLMPVPGLDGLSDLVSGLSVRMETAINELGERAALAAEMASSLDGRGPHVA
jgi:hypothetical protein